MTKTATIRKPRSERKGESWKGHSPTSGNKRGQWKQSKSEDDETGVGFVHLGVKLRPAEKEAFKIACALHGVTPNKAVRIFVRQSCGYLETSNDTLEHLVAITRQIGGVATNINQIAKAGNRTLSPDYLAFMEDRKELGAKLAELEDIIREIVNVGKRRSDGLRKLKDVVDPSKGDAA